MEYCIFKLSFKTAVHFGKRRLSDGENYIMADTLFSALCVEAAAFGDDVLDGFVKLAKSRDVVFSDTMPFIKESLYIPKPLIKVEWENSEYSALKKKFKKLKYIPINKLSNYLKGEIDPVEENESLDKLGGFSMRTLVSKRDSEKIKTFDALPFEVGTYTFNEGNGLYFVLGYKTKQDFLTVEKLLNSVGFSGIGGKRSSGYGKFSAKHQLVSKEFEQRLCSNGEKNLSLSVCMAKQDELDKAVDGANFLLTKRSGFIQSSTYDDTQRKKRDFYSFVSGSCFKNRFQGDIFDVSGKGNHSVYRYAIPMFLGVE